MAYPILAARRRDCAEKKCAATLGREAFHGAPIGLGYRTLGDEQI